MQGDHLYAELRERETAADMRAFLEAAKASCGEHGCPRILICVRDSRPVFKAEDYGLSGNVSALVTPECRIALLGDSSEHHHAHEYVEIVARQQGVNVKAFRAEAEALRWLRGEPLDSLQPRRATKLA
jgi:hypothetical protein